MPRRASSPSQPLKVGAIMLLLITLISGGYWLWSTISDPYRTLTPLDVPAYLENSNSLRGNTYKVIGTISDQLAWSPTAGKLLSIEVETALGSDMLPVLVPAQLSHINIQKGQKFFFKIEVGDQGILRAEDVKKV